MSQSAIVRIWQAFGLQPHKSETFKLSKDPFFVAKVRDIVGLYLDPPDRARARALAERIRMAVAAHTTTLDAGQTVRVTCSIGFAVAPRSGDAFAWGWEAVIALADHGTYAAKGLGRNRWVGYAAGDRALPPAVPTLSPDLIETWVADGRLRRECSVDASARAVA